MGRVYQGSLSERGIDRYHVELAAGHSLLLEVAQEEVDLVVRIAGPGGRGMSRFDSPTATLVPERICRVVEVPGTHTVDIQPYATAGTYTLRLVHVRPATDRDRRCGEAASVFASGQNATGAAGKLEHFERAGRLWEADGESLLAAIAWREVGSLFRHQGATAQAIARFERALTLARESGYPRLEVSVRNRLGLAYRDAEDLVRAASTLDRALDLARAAEDARGTASALTNRGLIDEEVGEPHRAVDRYREALELWRGEDDEREIAQTLINLGDVLGVLDHHDEALDVLDEALQSARHVRDRDLEANALASIGWIHRLRGEPAAGLAPLYEARKIHRAADDAKGEAGLLDRIGTLLRGAGELEAAERAYRSSLELSKTMDLPGYRADTLNNLGCLLVDTGRYREAAQLLADSLASFEVSDDPKARAHAEYCLGRLARRQGDDDSALVRVRRALEIVEGLRERARGAGHHYRPIWLWQDYAELELTLLLDRYRSRGDEKDLADAFSAADRMRARTLYELVAQTRAGAERAAGRVLEAEVERIQADLSALAAERRSRLAAASSPASSATRDTELDAEIRRLRLALQFAQAEMRAAARAAGRLGTPQSVSATEARRLLDPRTVLLVYILGTERSHLLALSHDRIEAFELPSRRILEDHAEGLYEALKESRQSSGQWLLVASAFGRLVLPPDAVPPDADRLMIAPDGILHYVPFAVLASPRTVSKEGAAERLVLDDFELVSVPSAAVLAALRARRRTRAPASRSVAVFADPVFSADDPRLGAAPDRGPSAAGGQGHSTQEIVADRVSRAIVADGLPDGPLPRLSATADEVAAILARVPPDQSLVHLGVEATKQAVRTADLRPYRILHFATHAWIDERFPELSGLVLSTVDHEGREIDGSLYLHEIDRLDLAADLTVLSGCQTALGRRVRGDGLLGLTQGFFHAGSSQVLVSLWALDDMAASRLMDDFYGRMLEDGETPTEALRHAQQWLRRQDGFEAPRYWAPFVLQGDG